MKTVTCSIIPSSFIPFVLLSLCALESNGQSASFVQQSLIIGLEGHAFELVMGLDAGASAGYDQAFDVVAPPALPSLSFDARVLASAGSNTDYFTDIRADSVAVFDFQIRAPGLASEVITLKWPDVQNETSVENIQATLVIGGQSRSLVTADSLHLEFTSARYAIGHVTLSLAQQTAIVDELPLLSRQPRIHAGFPNPFYKKMSLLIELPETAFVTIEIYNVTGQRVQTLINNTMSPGSHEIIWDGAPFPGGMYLVVFKADKFTATQKVMHLR